MRLNRKLVLLSMLSSMTLCSVVHGVPLSTGTGIHAQPKRVGKWIKILPLTQQPRFVSAAFIRMYCPDTIIGLANQVKAGRANISFLSEIVGPDLANRLVAANLAPLNKRIELKLTGAPASVLSDGMQSPAQANINFGNVAASAGPPPLTLPSSDYSPGSIDQGPLRENQTAYVVIKFTNPLQDNVTSSIGKTFSGAVGVSTEDSYTGLWQPTPQPNGPLEPIVATQVNGGQSLAATAGQDCAVHVKLKFPTKGTYNTSVTIEGVGAASWAFTVPIKATVTEMGTSGATAHDNDSDPTVFVGNTFDLPITVQPTKYKSPFSVKISPQSLPHGISVQDESVNVNSSNDAHLTLHIKADGNAATFRSEQMVFSVDAGDNKPSTLKADITVEPSIALWSFPTQTSSNVTWNNPSIWMASDGNWSISNNLVDNYTWSSDDAAWGVFYPTSLNTAIGVTETYSFPNNGITSYIPNPFESQPNFVVGSVADPYIGQSNWIKNNWGTVCRSEPAAWVYQGDISQNGNTSTIPTNPQIVVSQW